ncbi:N-terminal domain of oxidoreductase [Popillia japonica]|uniref:Prostaglandin reductase 1 n=1 Tax=Popillia japonica TaxID=7064 RepID=A0AAW1IGL4_POPJA
MMKAKVFIYVHPFEGMPTEENFRLIEEDLPPLKDGEFLAEAVYLSVDPYMRAYAPRLKVGETMIGSQVAKVIESKSIQFPIGSYVVGVFGWRTHTVVPENLPVSQFTPPPVLISYDGSVPLSYYLGVLGMPGATAYFGFLDICKPKPGETVVVSGAAGAVGSHVGQIAKIKGCKVIGIAGSDQKCQWLKTIGFDFVINYKKDNVEQALRAAAPNGVDCYFDNVGGEITTTVINQMNRFGRVSCCGAIASYNDNTPAKVTTFLLPVILQELEFKGFVIYTWRNKWNEAVKRNQEWMTEGKLQYQETITEGFENMPKALIQLMQGKNVGKAIVKV